MHSWKINCRLKLRKFPGGCCNFILSHLWLTYCVTNFMCGYFSVCLFQHVALNTVHWPQNVFLFIQREFWSFRTWLFWGHLNFASGNSLYQSLISKVYIQFPVNDYLALECSSLLLHKQMSLQTFDNYSSYINILKCSLSSYFDSDWYTWRTEWKITTICILSMCLFVYICNISVCIYITHWPL